ncbi:hypothetical protein L208DRAFT_141033 [Tricholoma matsutake]|nr:hypothetical protein L208DRAFT_141033 [Tricholoma matsutake 945]
MGALSSLPLDDDIIDRILTFLPSFSALGATILASKHFHTIFKSHPNSVLRSVAYNVTGPALPQAMRVIRYSPKQLDSEQDSLSNTPPIRPWAETDPISPITGEEASRLTENAAIVAALEDVFSSRHKDRTSQTSKLDSAESERFRCGVYRLMLFSQAFPLSEDEINEEDPDAMAIKRLERKRLLEEFPNYELLAMRSVSLFLAELVEWTDTVGGSRLYGPFPDHTSADFFLSEGPAAILAAYKAENGFDNTSIGYLAHPLNKIWEQRNMKPPPDDASHWKSILHDIRGEHDICHRCNMIHGFDLWNETNWDYLKGLSETREVSLLHSQLYAAGFTYTTLLQEINDIRTSEFDMWDKQDWLCLQCIQVILRSHLHLWLLERKRKAGKTIPEDCWYGYNCRTQTHSVHHASRLNHLCEPTR